MQPSGPTLKVNTNCKSVSWKKRKIDKRKTKYSWLFRCSLVSNRAIHRIHSFCLLELHARSGLFVWYSCQWMSWICAHVLLYRLYNVTEVSSSHCGTGKGIVHWIRIGTLLFKTDRYTQWLLPHLYLLFDISMFLHACLF